MSELYAVHRTRHVDIREDELYVGIGFEQLYGFVSVVGLIDFKTRRLDLFTR
jgi:hypothetical protein